MAELISLKEYSIDSKIALLKELGYSVNGRNIICENGSVVKDRYIDTPVKIENMLILPGSTIILDDNEISIISYFEEFGDL